MDLSKLLSRKLWMGGIGAALVALLETESDPTRLYVIGAIVIVYVIVQGINDRANAKTEAEKPTVPEGGAS